MELRVCLMCIEYPGNELAAAVSWEGGGLRVLRDEGCLLRTVNWLKQFAGRMNYFFS